jgi:uracil-DNA glycosylase
MTRPAAGTGGSQSDFSRRAGTASARHTAVTQRTLGLDDAVTAPEGRASLEDAREEAKGCRRCDLWKTGTQTVFGEGRRTARVVLVGEQPGDKEDLAGRPFVGPAGQLLDEGLEAAGIDRSQAYVTNVVKHFKWRARGKRRLHEKPNRAEIAACRVWLDTELAAIRPDVIVCLGATAAQALLGPSFRVTRDRGTFVQSSLAPHVIATIHPSAILRAEDEESRDAEMKRFIADLRKVARVLASG